MDFLIIIAVYLCYTKLTYVKVRNFDLALHLIFVKACVTFAIVICPLSPKSIEFGGGGGVQHTPSFLPVLGSDLVTDFEGHKGMPQDPTPSCTVLFTAHMVFFSKNVAQPPTQTQPPSPAYSLEI